MTYGKEHIRSAEVMILITGATGFIGRAFVKAAMEAGLSMRCLVPPQRLKAIAWDKDAPNAPELVIGSLLDEEACFKAVTGVHTIVHLENAFWWGGRADLARVEIAGTRLLTNLARSARVGRIILLSHLGATPASAYLLHQTKGVQEEIVRTCGLAYTIVRSGVVFGEEDAFINHMVLMLAVNPLFFLMPGEGEVVLHPLYIHDLVKVLMLALESLDVVDRTLEIGGMEYTSLVDLLFTLMRITKMRRVIIPVPPYVMRLLVRLYGLFLPRTLMTAQWLDLLATNHAAKLSSVYEYFGFQPQRLEDTLWTYLPKQRRLRRLLRATLRRRPRRL